MSKELDQLKTVDTQNVKEITSLKDSLASLKIVLEKEKCEKALLKSECQKIEDNAQKRLKELQNELSTSEAKWKKEVQESNECVIRLKQEMKGGTKESSDRIRSLENEVLTFQRKQEDMELENKRLKERLESSQCYINVLTEKKKQKNEPIAVPASSTSDSTSSSDNEAVKALEHNNQLLKNSLETLKAKEGELLKEKADLEKTVKESVARQNEFEMKLELSLKDNKNLGIQMEQLKQMKRVYEERIQNLQEEVESAKSLQSSFLEQSLCSDNSVQIELKKLQSELIKSKQLFEQKIAKLESEKKEVEEERDECLNMLASNSLESEMEMEQATKALKEEIEMQKQSLKALEEKLRESKKELKDYQSEMIRRKSLLGSPKQEAMGSPTAKPATDLLSVNDNLKNELSKAKESMHSEMQSLSDKLRQEMASHQKAVDELKSLRLKVEQQSQSYEKLKEKVNAVTAEKNEISEKFARFEMTDKQQSEGNAKALTEKTEQCKALQNVLDDKELKVETLNLKVEELKERENDLLKKHGDLRERMNEMITKDKEKDAAIDALQGSKAKLDKKYEELMVEKTAQTQALKKSLSELQARHTECERQVKELTESFGKEKEVSESLRCKISLLENDLLACESMKEKCETSMKATIDELNARLQGETERLTQLLTQREQDFDKEMKTLKEETEELRTKLASVSQTSQSQMTEKSEELNNLANAVKESNDKLRDCESSLVLAKTKHSNLEQTLLSVTEKCERLEEDLKKEKDNNAQLIQENEICRSLCAETELNFETLQSDFERVKRSLSDEKKEEMEKVSDELNEWRTKCQDLERQCDMYKDQIESLEQEVERQKERINSLINDNDIKLNEVKNDKEERLMELNHTLFELKNKESESQKKIEDLETSVASLEKTVQRVKSEKEKMELNHRIKVDELEDCIAELNEESERKTEEMKAEWEKERMDATEKLRQLQTEADNLKLSKTVENQDFTQSVASLKNEIADMTLAMDQLKSEIAEHSATIERLTEDKNSALNSLDETKSELTDLRFKLEEREKDVQDKEKSIASLRAELEQLSSTLSSTQSTAVTEVESVKETLLEEREKQQKEKEKLDVMLADTKDALKSREKEMTELKEILAKEREEKKTLESKLEQTEKAVEELEDKTRLTQMEKESGDETLKTLEKSLKIVESQSQKKEEEWKKELQTLSLSLQDSQKSVKEMEEKMLLLTVEISNEKEKVKILEGIEREKEEDCSMLVQSLAETELKVDELESDLKRIRYERDDLKATRESLFKQNKAHEKEIERLSKTLSVNDDEKSNMITEMQDKLSALERALSDEKEALQSLSNEKKLLERNLKSAELREKELEKEKTMTVERLLSEREKLEKELSDAKENMDVCVETKTKEKQTLTMELKDLKGQLEESRQTTKMAEKTVASLTAELEVLKEDLSEHQSKLRSLSSMEQKLSVTESKLAKLTAQYESENATLKSRIANFENDYEAAQNGQSEWKVKYERMEKEYSLSNRDREKLAEELKTVKDSLSSLQSLNNDRTDDIQALKQQFEEEKINHSRTQRGIVDQQKLIASHVEKNAKLSAMIEEQKEQMQSLNKKLQELEKAGSEASNTLALQKEIEKLKHEQASQKALVAQKTAEAQKLNAMLVSFEEKVRNNDSAQEMENMKDEMDILRKRAEESQELTEKYNAVILENRKLEKRLSSQEAKVTFLKKKLEKLETSK